jgi:hypothetical protein
MDDFAFKPAGLAFAAVVAGLAAPGAVAEEATVPSVPAAEAAVEVSLPAAAPFGAEDHLAAAEAAANAHQADVPLAPAVQLRLPFE